ncbi:alpha-2,8-sialyltransferase 8B-like isoform X2 [Ptychodera flava]|uniref:alpha-2,8-sialyltransferase 8B-like isoform X2 n=1 Tax=Ptychodera flava TaxID=63121 RepID=UPI00396A9BDA
MDRVKQLRRLFVSLIVVSCLSSVLYFHRGITEFGFTIWLASKVPTYSRHPCVHGTDNSSSSVEISPSTSRCHFPPCLVCPSALQNVTSLKGIREVLSREIDLKSTMTIFKDNLDVTLEYCCRQFSTRKEIPDRSRRKYNQYFRTIGRQKSCAIVGASGILLNSRCGREIDGHDFVMRINLAPTAGFEKDVGGRTNLTAVNNIVMHRVRRYLSNPDDEVQKKRNEKLFHSLKSINNSIVWFGYNITEKIYLMHFAKKDLMRMKNYKRVMNLNYTLAYSLVPIWSRIVLEKDRRH